MRIASLVVVFGLLGVITIPARAADPPVFLLEWGSNGSGNGEFDLPVGIAVDDGGTVYVVDSGNGRVQRFSGTGGFVDSWGSWGTADAPHYIAIDESGFVYVTDQGHKVQKFTAGGSLVTAWGTEGSGPGEFQLPQGIAADGMGHIYVADFLNARVQKFTSAGVFVTAWGSGGLGDGEFTQPIGVAADGGSVYVSDFLRVQKFGDEGAFLASWTIGNGDEHSLYGLAVRNAEVYAANRESNCVHVHSTDGTFLVQWSVGFNWPAGVALNQDGEIFITDVEGSRVVKYGQFIPIAPTTWSLIKSDFGRSN